MPVVQKIENENGDIIRNEGIKYRQSVWGWLTQNV
jgi:hypothetical protein